MTSLHMKMKATTSRRERNMRIKTQTQNLIYDVLTAEEAQFLLVAQTKNERGTKFT
ncbi:hypothetical protein KSC_039620 [Ktedonobacter sp. SOSP1-52]|nr:hypothetical protein KSC_039620 [Ktedonobacter sp. SOSP1-52]